MPLLQPPEGIPFGLPPDNPSPSVLYPVPPLSPPVVVRGILSNQRGAEVRGQLLFLLHQKKVLLGRGKPPLQRSAAGLHKGGYVVQIRPDGAAQRFALRPRLRGLRALILPVNLERNAAEFFQSAAIFFNALRKLLRIYLIQLGQ